MGSAHVCPLLYINHMENHKTSRDPAFHVAFERINQCLDVQKDRAKDKCNVKRTQTIAASYRRQEKEKRRAYEKRVIEVEHGLFTPIVLSSTGGMGSLAMTFYKRLASLITSKHAASYSTTMRMIRCKISFSLINLAVMCLRGARSSYGVSSLLCTGHRCATIQQHLRPAPQDWYCVLCDGSRFSGA